MKNRIYLSLQAAAVTIACWLLPTQGWASVTVEGVNYDLDEATKTAVVVPGSDTSIEYLTIPENITLEGITYTVTAIADCAFLDFHNLKEVDIESYSLTNIGFSAFERCYSLANIFFVDGLTEFQYEAFKDCRSLSRIILPSTLRAIGDRSFQGCTSLKVINVPAKVDYIGRQWVSGCPLALLIAEPKKPLPVKASRFEGIDKENCILGVPEGSKAAYQSANVWKEFANIKEGAIEVDQCGNNVFYAIFADRTMYAFGQGPMNDFWRHNIHSVFGENNVEEVTIGEGVTHIGAYAFSSWHKLSTINIPTSLTSIGQYAFHWTPWYENQPDGSVAYLDKWAYGLKGMDGADVVLLDGTVGHAASAFLDCNIASLSIPASMTYINPILLDDYDGREYSSSFGEIGSIVVDAANPLFDSRDDCNAIIETASNTLIVGCRNMEIPESVTAIGPFAFCKLTSVVIPSNVTAVDWFAFTEMCFPYRLDEFYKFIAIGTPLQSVKMEGSVPPAMSLTNPYLQYDFEYKYFAGVGGNYAQSRTLYVPIGSKEAYQSADGWKDFIIEEYDPEGELTAIESVSEPNAAASTQIFDLQGRRLNDASSHSIVIENGRKRIQR